MCNTDHDKSVTSQSGTRSKAAPECIPPPCNVRNSGAFQHLRIWEVCYVLLGWKDRRRIERSVCSKVLNEPPTPIPHMNRRAQFLHLKFSKKVTSCETMPASCHSPHYPSLRLLSIPIQTVEQCPHLGLKVICVPPATSAVIELGDDTTVNATVTLPLQE